MVDYGIAIHGDEEGGHVCQIQEQLDSAVRLLQQAQQLLKIAEERRVLFFDAMKAESNT